MPLANRKPANISLFKTGCHVLQEGLELLILLPQPSEGWDYKSVPLHPVYAVLRIKLRALYLLGKPLCHRSYIPMPVLWMLIIG